MFKRFFFELFVILGRVPFLGKLQGIVMRFDPIYYMRKQGATIGKHCRWQSQIMSSEPYLITIGDHVSVGTNVQFVTHEGAVWVLRELCNDDRLELFGAIKVGDNVFLGNNSMIMPNVSIGNNVIVGAGSVVTKDVPSDTIVGGVPARIIGNTHDFANRKLNNCLRTRMMKDREKQKIVIEKIKGKPSL